MTTAHYECVSQRSYLLSGAHDLHGFIPITFNKANLCCVDATIHSALISLKVPNTGSASDVHGPIISVFSRGQC